VVHLSLLVFSMDLSKLQISSNTGGLKITTHADQAGNHEISGRLGLLLYESNEKQFINVLHKIKTIETYYYYYYYLSLFAGYLQPGT